MTIKPKRLFPEKQEDRRRGRRWGKLYGMLLDIHKEIDPIIKKRNEAMAEARAELTD